MSRTSLALIAVLVTSCTRARGASGSITDPDGNPGPPACAAIDLALTDAVKDRGSCSTDDDCTLIGGQLELATCDCAPYVLDCSGMAIARNAPHLEAILGMIQDYVASGCATHELCDCAPSPGVHCTNHICGRDEPPSCFPDPPLDAAPPE